ncbi:GPW/gp25 family protein [Pseudochelatococcus sp. G4_1912]|uniref:GPW/gp25 family protein n=1 Tax=Pseudochelatococcus sp. G4_1912 TaxID=3114288 RepID=UPI0039C71FED
MPDSVGFDRMTGAVITDWDHVAQSIGVILTTPRFTRVMRRLFGSDLPSLIDAPMNDQNRLRLFRATAEALRPRLVEGRQYGEPRFALERVMVSNAQANGRIVIVVSGRYVPRGHVGDATPAGQKTLEVAL